MSKLEQMPCNCGECNQCKARELGLDIETETYEKIPHKNKPHVEIVNTKPRSESERIDRTNLI